MPNEQDKMMGGGYGKNPCVCAWKLFIDFHMQFGRPASKQTNKC